MEPGGREAWLVGSEVRHVYVSGTSVWKTTLECGAGDTGLGVIGHDLSAPFL